MEQSTLAYRTLADMGDIVITVISRSVWVTKGNELVFKVNSDALWSIVLIKGVELIFIARKALCIENNLNKCLQVYLQHDES